MGVPSAKGAGGGAPCVDEEDLWAPSENWEDVSLTCADPITPSGDRGDAGEAGSERENSGVPTADKGELSAAFVTVNCPRDTFGGGGEASRSFVDVEGPREPSPDAEHDRDPSADVEDSIILSVAGEDSRTTLVEMEVPRAPWVN